MTMPWFSPSANCMALSATSGRPKLAMAWVTHEESSPSPSSFCFGGGGSDFSFFSFSSLTKHGPWQNQKADPPWTTTCWGWGALPTMQKKSDLPAFCTLHHVIKQVSSGQNGGPRGSPDSASKAPLPRKAFAQSGPATGKAPSSRKSPCPIGGLAVGVPF